MQGLQMLSVNSLSSSLVCVFSMYSIRLQSIYSHRTHQHRRNGFGSQRIK
ncbi:hypothetical protein Hanom_Chr03g00267191 [Helianthus anomalus]